MTSRFLGMDLNSEKRIRYFWEDSSMPITIGLPRFFNRRTMYAFINSAIDIAGNPRDSVIDFDFLELEFIEPDGVTALCNLIGLLRAKGVQGRFRGHDRQAASIRYLDDCGIFNMCIGRELRPGRENRATTMPYKLVPSGQVHGYLDITVSPWLANALGVSEGSLADFRASIRELFTNIEDHSTQNIGGMHIQYFPNRNIISVSVSDFGIGIPSAINNRFSFGRDCNAIRYALNEGVSTRSPPRHSGAGLAYLVDYVTCGNRGHVTIYSNKGQVVCFPGRGGANFVERDAPGFYPGTLVALDLRTDTIGERETEDLEW